MSTSHLKRSLELLESDHGKTTCRKGKAGVNGNSKKSKSQTKRKQGHQSFLWHTNSDRSKRNEIDLTKDNLSVLMLLSSRHVDDDTANKILVRAGKKKIEEVAVLKDEKTAFTEEDFLDFEKEYFVSDK